MATATTPTTTTGSNDSSKNEIESDVPVKVKPTASEPDVLIHVINVGQGDSILVELGYKSETLSKKWYLIDGGRECKTEQKKQAKQEQKTSTPKRNEVPQEPMERKSEQPHKEHGDSDQEKKLFNLEKTLEEKGRVQLQENEEKILNLDAIIITHPDEDHMGGINRLIKNFTITCPIITTEATQVTNARLRPRNTKLELPTCIELKFPSVPQRVYDIKKAAEIKKDNGFKGDTNESSILFSVGRTIQLTGDSKGTLIHRETGLGKIEDLIRDVIVFQVPHHGSKNNSFVSRVASLNLSESDSLYELQKNSSNKHPAYRESLFYRGVQAKTYFISFGYESQHKHPHSDVITGIIISAVTQRKKCTIVTTANFSHDRVNYPDPEKYEKFPQGWKQYVDIVVPEKEDTPYITITGDGAVSHTKPWEPDKPSMKTRSSDKTEATV